LTAFSPPNGLIIFLILRILANYFLSADIVTIIIAEESPNNIRGRLIGVVLAANAIGGMACGIIQTLGFRIPIPGPWGFAGSVIGSMTVWQSLFFLTIIGYIFVIPLFLFLKETKRFAAMKKYEDWRKKKGLKPKTGWFVPLQKKYARGMVTGMIVGFLAQLIYFAQVTFFALYFAKELNMSSKIIGILSLPLMAAAGIGMIIAGPIIDRWGRLPVIHRFGCTTLIGGLLFSWPTVFVCGDIANPLLTILVLTGGMIGIFSLVMLSAAGAIISLELLPTHILSTAMGWIGAISRGAVILAPFLMMFGAETLGGLGLSYQFMFLLMGMPLTTILFVAYLLVPESKGRSLEEIVATEVYTKIKKIDDKKYKEPYYLYLLGLILFFICGIIYGFTTDASFLAIFSIVGFYSGMCAGCFIIAILVRRMITE
jgi:MFS family permease